MSNRPASPPAVTTPLRVLLIDDSEDDATLVLRALRAGGYAPEWRRADDATSLAAALDEPWELVLSDWNLPGFGGAAALAMLRERGIDAPIIIVSSDLGEDGAVTAMKGGATDYVTKHRLTRLVPAIERELREAETRRAARAAADALRVSEERFAKAFEYAPYGMAMVTIGGTIVKVNRAFGRMFGYSEEEMRNIPVWQVTHPDDMPATFAAMERLLDDEIEYWDLEKRFFHRDGHLLWGHSTTWLVRDAAGAAQYVISQLEDITEWKRLQEERRRQQAALEHALRVASMAETVAQVAHEINQPLASIANFANGLTARLDRGAVPPPAVRDVAAQIAAEALRAGAAIRRLRALLAQRDLTLTRCDANDVVRDAVRIIEPDLREHAIRCALALAPQGLPVAVDRVQIEQVMLHLLRNALDAQAAATGDQRTITVHSERDACGQVSVRVHDTGVGLPAAAGTEIFDPFFTTKDGALGLGLAISRSIVHAHGGDLRATANADGGATVGFTLPGVD